MFNKNLKLQSYDKKILEKISHADFLAEKNGDLSGRKGTRCFYALFLTLDKRSAVRIMRFLDAPRVRACGHC